MKTNAAIEKLCRALYRSIVAHPDNIRWATQGPVVRALMPSGVSRALDVGCGGGRYTECLASRAERVVGVEPDWAQICRVRAKGRAIWLVQGAAEALPFRGGSFDLVLCTEVLEHLEDDAAGLAELRRVLRSRGRLILSVPLLPPPYPDPAHRRAGYTARGLRDLVERAGFRIEEARFCMFRLSRLMLRWMSAFVGRFRIAPPLLPIIHLERVGWRAKGEDALPFNLVVAAGKDP